MLSSLRAGEFDCLIGINLLREGIDLPEVALVAILDADKEGFLRSAKALLQVAGRAARNVEGRVILYGDRITPSMKTLIKTSKQHRKKQEAYNAKNDIIPQTIKKAHQVTINEAVAPGKKKNILIQMLPDQYSVWKKSPRFTVLSAKRTLARKKCRN